MKKTIRNIGNSLGVIYNKEECRTNDYELGDILDQSDQVLIKKKKVKKK